MRVFLLEDNNISAKQKQKHDWINNEKASHKIVCAINKRYGNILKSVSTWDVLRSLTERHFQCQCPSISVALYIFLMTQLKRSVMTLVLSPSALFEAQNCFRVYTATSKAQRREKRRKFCLRQCLHNLKVIQEFFFLLLFYHFQTSLYLNNSLFIQLHWTVYPLLTVNQSHVLKVRKSTFMAWELK